MVDGPLGPLREHERMSKCSRDEQDDDDAGGVNTAIVVGEET